MDGTFTKGVSSMEMPQIFENKEFGKVRVTEYNGAPWFVASWGMNVQQMQSTFTVKKPIKSLNTVIHRIG